MSTDKTAQSIKNYTETSSESDKIQSKALNEASTTITTFESEKSDDIKGNKTFQVNNFLLNLVTFPNCPTSYSDFCHYSLIRGSPDDIVIKKFADAYAIFTEHPNDMKLDITTPTGNSRMTIPESSSDFRQWLQSMLAVARLPGGLPTEFRRKVATDKSYLKRQS